jgi:type IV secretory pathway TraG/TraD family ATPase VirD4
LAAAGVLAVGLPIAVLVWGAVAAGGGDTSGGPVATLLRLVSGQLAWPGAWATVALLTELFAVGGLGVLGYWAWRRFGTPRGRVDAAAAAMGRGKAIDPLRPDGAAARARRLIGDKATTDPATHGPLIGLSVAGNTPLRSSWEDTCTVIAGPRTMKTSTQVIPMCLDAPGPVVVTSNKRDVVDTLRGPRSARKGAHVWVFDPQDLAGEPCSWWWNPLSQVRSVTDASRLAGHFAAGSKQEGMTRDAYFDTSGEDLLGHLLLAAAASKASILEVYRWLTEPTNRAPAAALTRAGHDLAATALTGYIQLPEKQRAGVYGTARMMASCLVEPSVTRWVTPQPANRPQLDPEQLVVSNDTLFALSREGERSATPLVTALIAAILETGERVAMRSAGGRLPVPLVAALDEAANVCRISKLPDLYSHYGSRGLVLKTILQNWKQGEAVWGKIGMQKLWDATNVKVYGGGVADPEFLESLSKLVGEVDSDQWSTSWSQGKRSVQHSTRRLRILDVAELAALPPGRAIVIASGMAPTLVKPQPWWTGPWAPAVEASLNRHDPGRAARS